MNALDLDNDAGFIEVAANGATVRLDVFATVNRLKDFHRANAALSDTEYNQKLVELLDELGLPGCSEFQACRFAQRLHQAADDLAKKNESSPASPASTA